MQESGADPDREAGASWASSKTSCSSDWAFWSAPRRSCWAPSISGTRIRLSAPSARAEPHRPGRRAGTGRATTAGRWRRVNATLWVPEIDARRVAVAWDPSLRRRVDVVPGIEAARRCDNVLAA